MLAVYNLFDAICIVFLITKNAIVLLFILFIVWIFQTQSAIQCTRKTTINKQKW